MEEQNLIAKIAHMYYMEGIDLKTIGEIFNISYATVSRLLKKGRGKGIIKIIINNPHRNTIKQESKLKQYFKLREVFAVPSEENFVYPLILDLIGREAANYLVSVLRDGDFLGISWGRTVYNVVNNFQKEKKIKVHVVQLFGQTSNVPVELSSFDLVRRMKNMFLGSYYFINSEAVLEKHETKKYLLDDPSIKNTFDAHKCINIAVSSVGICDLESSGFVHRRYLRNEEIEEIKREKIIGETNFTFFDAEGNIKKIRFNDRMMAIETNDLLKIKNKIIVAGGLEKAEAVLGALKAGLVNTLFTDSITLSKLISML